MGCRRFVVEWRRVMDCDVFALKRSDVPPRCGVVRRGLEWRDVRCCEVASRHDVKCHVLQCGAVESRGEGW